MQKQKTTTRQRTQEPKLYGTAFKATGLPWAAGALAVLLMLGTGLLSVHAQTLSNPASTPSTPGSSSSGGNTSLSDVLNGGPQQCTPGGQDPGTPDCEVAAGNPLNVLGGNKYQREVDMPPLPGVLGLELVRHYNSDLSGYGPRQGAIHSPLGRGWRLGYDGWLRFASVSGARLQPQQVQPHERITYSAGDGTQTPLQHLSNEGGGRSQWASAAGEQVLSIDLNNSSRPYLLKDLRSGEQRLFDRQGRQVRIQAAGGHVVQIERDEHGRITRVVDPQGRALVLHYPESVLPQGTAQTPSKKRKPRIIRQAQAIDTPLGRFEFAFGHRVSAQQSPEVLIPLAQTRAQASSLMQVRRPDGSVRHYHHEDPNHPSLLTGISEQASRAAPQRQVSWAYDQLGRAIRSVKGAIPPQGQRGHQDVSLRFLGPQGSKRRDGSGVTLLTNSAGEHTRYEYAMLGGRRQLTLVQGAGCSSCGSVNVRYGYDSLGRRVSFTGLSPVSVDENGQVKSQAQALISRLLTLDPQGRVLRIEKVRYQGGKEIGKELFERREYADVRWPYHPTRIDRPSVIATQLRRIKLSYNAAGQLSEVKETGYSPLDGQGNLAANTSSATLIERLRQWRYQTINGVSVLVEIDGPLLNGPQASPTDSDVTRLSWDESGQRVLAITHPMGLVERLEYDSTGAARLIARVDVLGVRTELRWQPHAQRLSQLRRAGLQIDLTHDSLGRVTLYVRNDGAQIGVAYDDTHGANAMVRYTLPDGEVKEIRYDSEGRTSASQWKDGAGQVLVGGVQIDWGVQDEQGLRDIRITEATGVITTLRANPLLASSQSQRGQDQARLQRSEQFDAAQHLLQVQRNEALTQIKDEGPNSATHASRSLTLPHGASHRQWTDDFGRVVRIEHPETGIHRAAYDEADRQTARWDSSRHSSAMYDALGRLIQLRHANNDGASVQSTSAVVKAVVNAEETTTWQYGEGGAGTLLVRQTSSQQDKHFGYDANGRLIEERLNLRRQGQDVNTTREAEEWLPALVTRYKRDSFGRILRIYLPEGSVLTQWHNAQGRIEAIALQEPASRWWHRAIRWVWAEHGTRDLITDVQHSASRGLQGYQHANGSAARSTHDRAGRLTQWSDGPFKTGLDFNEHAQMASLKTEAPEVLLRPGQVGPTQVAAQALQQREQSLRYDPFGRLRQISEGPKSKSFEYDRNGNRIVQTSDTLGQLTEQFTYTLAAQSDRLLSVQDSQGQAKKIYRHNGAGEPVEIDDAGNKSTRRLYYNALGQIGAIEQDGQLLAHYAYNGERQRVAKSVAHGHNTEGTTTIYFTWHGGLLDAELDGQGRVERRTIYFNLRPVALIEYGYGKDSKDPTATRLESTQRLAIHGDHLGTPQAITDEQQRVVWLARYEAFGRATVQGLSRSEVTAQNRSGGSRSWIGTAYAAAVGAKNKLFEFHLRFSGQYEDGETGWHYNWHRYYDPETGRYLTPDPIGLSGGVNAYGYAGGDPLGAVDPWGLVDINLFNVRENIFQYAEKVPDDPSVFTVGGHGSPNLMQDENYENLSAADVADLIKSDPKYKPGMPVKLLSCETGQGSNSFAQQLANALGSSTVSAPTTLLWYYSNGTLKPVGGKADPVTGRLIQDPANPGQMLDFDPEK